MRILVLFNLHSGVDPAAYEAWARETDLPGVRKLGSISDFQVYRLTGLLGGSDKPPFAHAEVIDVKDMDAFGRDAASDAIQKVAAEFRRFADNPLFITTEAL